MRVSIRTLLAALLISPSAAAQVSCPDNNANCSSVPRLVRFTGMLTDPTGSPRSGVAGIIFSIYTKPSGGALLWQETQNVNLDSQGRYAVLLGVTKAEGLPVEVFNSFETTWIGVWPQFEGEQEHSRVPLGERSLRSQSCRRRNTSGNSRLGISESADTASDT